MPLSPACLGKTYPPLTTTVTRDATQNYARACKDDNPRYFDDDAAGGIVAPPMFAAVVTWLSVLTVMTDAELHADLLRLLHSAQDMEFLAPIFPGDSITSTAKIASIESHQGGESMALELEARNSRGDLVNRSVFTSFIRGRRSSAPPVDFEGRTHERSRGASRHRRADHRPRSDFALRRGFGRPQPDSRRCECRQNGGPSRHHRSRPLHDGLHREGDSRSSLRRRPFAAQAARRALFATGLSRRHHHHQGLAVR